jgi:hypothetical protein
MILNLTNAESWPREVKRRAYVVPDCIAHEVEQVEMIPFGEEAVSIE